LIQIIDAGQAFGYLAARRRPLDPARRAAAPRSPAKMSLPQPTRAADFIGVLGVNITLQGAYSATTAIADMAYLGLGRVRTGAVNPGDTPTQVAAYGALAAAGLKFDLYTRRPVAGVLSSVDALVRAHPGSVVSIEGPDEVNNFPMTYGNLTGNAAAVAYQRALYSGVKSDPLLASVPVLNFTSDPYTPGAADASNAHPYPKDGKQPFMALEQAYDQRLGSTPGKPVYFTEAGYATLTQPGQALGVDDKTQAKLILNMVMDAAKLGVAATYLYDLVDDAPDPTGAHPADHYGLFTTAGVAKPSAVALHDLTSILADTGAAATTFTPTPLRDTISGLPASGSSLVIEKSSGVYDIVVWAEPQIWNAATATPIAAPGNAVTINLGARFKQVQVFDPLLSTAAVRTASNTNSVTINVVDHPLIVQVSNFAAAMAAAGATSAAVVPSTPPAPSYTMLATPARV